MFFSDICSPDSFILWTHLVGRENQSKNGEISCLCCICKRLERKREDPYQLSHRMITSISQILLERKRS